MQCDLCGKKTDELFLVLVEGTKLKVCKSCAKYGKVLSKLGSHSDSDKHVSSHKPVKREPVPEPSYCFVDNFGKVVESARLKRGWKQVELAKKLAIKESLLHKIETSSLEPSIDLARRIERLLSVKILVEASEGVTVKSSARKNSSLTLGDLVKVRKRSSK